MTRKQIMTKYALIINGPYNSYDYTPLQDGITIKEAELIALEYINDQFGYYNDDINHDLQFSIIETGDEHKYSTDDFKEWFDKKHKEDIKQARAQQDRADKILYEELKKRFG